MKITKREQSNVKVGILIGLALIGLFILLYAIFKIRGIFPPIFYGILLAYVLLPITNFLSRKIPRFLGSLISILLFILILVFIGYIIFPKVTKEMGEVITRIPEILDSISDIIGNIINKLPVSSHSSNVLKTFLNNAGNVLEKNMLAWEQYILTTVMQKISLIPSFAISIILAFFFMKDSEILFRNSSKLFKNDKGKVWIKFLTESDKEIRAYYGTILLVAISTGIAMGIMCYLIGIKYFLLIGFMDAFLELLPYVGPTTVYIIGAIFAMFSSLNKFLLFSTFFFAIEIVQSQIVIPYFTGRKINLPPVAIILIILIGGKLAGILGVIIAVPAFVLIRNTIKILYPEFYKSTLHT